MASFLILNCIVTVTILTFLYKKINELTKPKSIQNVLLSNSASACCGNLVKTKCCQKQYCFKKNLRKIIQAIDRSKYSICLALYTLSLSEILDEIVKAHDRGVEVRILTSEESMIRHFLHLPISGK